MPQTFVAASSTPDPYAVLLAAAGQISVFVQADVLLTWADATHGTIPATILATSAYGGTSVDGVTDVYYLLGIKSSPTPVLLKEKDIATADTVIGGSPSWGKLARIENGEIMPCPQP